MKGCVLMGVYCTFPALSHWDVVCSSSNLGDVIASCGLLMSTGSSLQLYVGGDNVLIRIGVEHKTVSLLSLVVSPTPLLTLNYF